MKESIIYIFLKAFQLFLVLDPLGNTGIVATLIGKLEKKRQKAVLIRELCIALIIMLIIFFSGSALLRHLNLSEASVTLTGGIIFFLFSIHLLFPGSGVITLSQDDDEPFIVPIATPLVVGPSSIATIVLFTHDKDLYYLSLVAVVIAWFATSIIILLGPFLLSKIGKTGMHVIERFIGLLCALIAVKMVLKGIKYFLLSLT